MQPDPTLVATVRQRLAPLEATRTALRRKIILGTVLGVALVIAAIPGAFVVGGSFGWLLTTYVHDTVFSLLIGYAAGIVVTGYVTYRIIRRFMLGGEAAQLGFGKRWHEDIVLPLLRESRPGVKVAPESTLDHETFRASQMFSGSTDDQFDSALGISGTSHGIAWHGARVNVHYTTASRDNSGGHTAWRLRGWYFHLAHPSPWPGTVRLVDKPIYTTFVPGHTKISRAARVVKIDSGDTAFEAHGVIALDEGYRRLPPLPSGLLQAWVSVRERVGLPIFLALNASGTYLGVSTGDGPLPLDYNWATANDPNRLAADLLSMRQLPWAIEQFTAALAVGTGDP